MLVVCERWVGDGNRLIHIDPKFFLRPLQHFFLILARLLNRESLKAQALCLELVLTPRAYFLQLRLELNWNWLTESDWLTQAVLAPGYIIVWLPLASCGRRHLHRIKPRPRVKVMFRYFRPDSPYFFFNLTCGIFLHVRLRPPHTHILQTTLKDNNSI